MIPIGDENPSRIFPVVNWAIIITCIGVFIWQTSSGVDFFRETIEVYGLTPSEVLRGEALYSFVTSIFLHGG